MTKHLIMLGYMYHDRFNLINSKHKLIKPIFEVIDNRFRRYHINDYLIEKIYNFKIPDEIESMIFTNYEKKYNCFSLFNINENNILFNLPDMSFDIDDCSDIYVKVFILSDLNIVYT